MWLIYLSREISHQSYGYSKLQHQTDQCGLKQTAGPVSVYQFFCWATKDNNSKPLTGQQIQQCTFETLYFNTGVKGCRFTPCMVYFLLTLQLFRRKFEFIEHHSHLGTTTHCYFCVKNTKTGRQTMLWASGTHRWSVINGKPK